MPAWFVHLASVWSAAELGAVLSPASRFFLPYLVATLIFALLICRRRVPSWRAACAATIRRDVFLHKSARNDYVLAALNMVLLTAIPAAGLLSLTGMASATAGWLHCAFGAGPNWAPGTAVMAVYSLVLFVALDGANFLQHWLQHRIPMLWELHKVHHSAEVMTPITSVRVHPLSALFGAQVLAAVNGTVAGLFLFFFGGHIAVYPLIGMNVLLALHYTVGVYHLQHSHIWLSFPPGLRGIFLSPAAHMIHHSANPKHFDRNFAFVLTLWDRLAGTLYLPDDHEQHGLRLGLGDAGQRAMQTAWQLYTTPLRRIVAMAGGGRRATALAKDRS